jgi:hypothetical protein
MSDDSSDAKRLAAQVLTEFIEMNIAAVAYTYFRNYLDGCGEEESFTRRSIVSKLDECESDARKAVGADAALKYIIDKE